MNKLINISEATSIAIHTLAILHKETDTVNAQYLSDYTGFSKNHISKVLQLLVKQGYVVSRRGPMGGFAGTAKINELTLLNIYELFDGKIGADYCKHHAEICPFSFCGLAEIVDGLTETFVSKFSETKVIDLKIA